MLIKVTQEDIDLVIPNDIKFSPTALAIGILLDDNLDVLVFDTEIIIRDVFLEDEYRISTPEIVKLNEERFSRGEVIEPFEFELEIPSRFLYEGSEEDEDDSSSSNNTPRHSQSSEEVQCSVQSPDSLLKKDV